MPYVTRDQMEALFSPEFLLQALDGDHDGVEDAGAFAALASAASSRVDGLLGMAFEVPFAAPYPAVVVEAAKVYLADSLYRRRYGAAKKDENPWAEQAAGWDERLEAIAMGRLPMWPRTAVRGGRIAPPARRFDPDNQRGV